MTSPLSTDQIEQLTPLLGSLARMAARGSSLSEAELRTLLKGADVADKDAAQAELQRWAELLLDLRADAGLRLVIGEALMQRGLPEAPVLLAIDTVAGGPTVSGEVPVSPPPAPRLAASVASLDFGTLRAGQSDTREFEVTGGPGQVVVDGDEVRITPTQFGVEPTLVRVEVRPSGGSLMWTPLKLVTPGETLEVPVIAQWEQPVPVVTQPPTASPKSTVAAPLASPRTILVHEDVVRSGPGRSRRRTGCGLDRASACDHGNAGSVRPVTLAGMVHLDGHEWPRRRSSVARDDGVGFLF